MEIRRVYSNANICASECNSLTLRAYIALRGQRVQRHAMQCIADDTLLQRRGFTRTSLSALLHALLQPLPIPTKPSQERCMHFMGSIGNE